MNHFALVSLMTLVLCCTVYTVLHIIVKYYPTKIHLWNLAATRSLVLISSVDVLYYIISAFLLDLNTHTLTLVGFSLWSCLKSAATATRQQTNAPGHLDRVMFFQTEKKCSKCHSSQRSRNTAETSSASTWERWPNSSAAPAKNNPDHTKWDLALTAHSSLETISPIMHMTCVSGTVSSEGCIMNSAGLWTPHNEDALHLWSCHACSFNGLISEAIIVNTSRRRCLEHSGEVAGSPLGLVAYWLVCE